MHYNMPPVAGMAPPGAFRIPKDVFEALGRGDLKLGGAVAHAMFGIEDDPETRPSFTPTPCASSATAGSLPARVLQRFVQYGPPAIPRWRYPRARRASPVTTITAGE